MEEPPCFHGISLDPIIYLRSIKILKDYFKNKGLLDKEIFMLATQKL